VKNFSRRSFGFDQKNASESWNFQIDGTGAKLLIEALSGRWSYDTDRREKRTVWYHVANAFSLLVSTIAPQTTIGDFWETLQPYADTYFCSVSEKE